MAYLSENFFDFFPPKLLFYRVSPAEELSQLAGELRYNNPYIYIYIYIYKLKLQFIST